MKYKRISIRELSGCHEHVTEVQKLRGSYKIVRPTANIHGASPHIMKLLEMSSSPMIIPTVVEYILRDPIIIDDGIVLIDEFVLEETLADTKAGAYGDVIVSENYVEWSGAPIVSEHSGLLLKKRGQTNFGHWIIELLPKLYLAKNCNSVLVSDPTRGFEFVRRMYHESVGIISPSTQVISTSKKAQKIRSLTYICGVSVNGNYFHPSLQEMAHVMSCSLTTSPKYDKIFITRPYNLGRGISNQHEVERFFSSKGYEIIEPSSLSLIDQISIFSNAKEIFGIQGAAMCNTIFSGPDAKVGYLSPHYMNGRFFYNMDAAMDRAKFNVLFCESHSVGKPTLRDSIIVDLSYLEDFYGSSINY